MNRAGYADSYHPFAHHEHGLAGAWRSSRHINDRYIRNGEGFFASATACKSKRDCDDSANEQWKYARESQEVSLNLRGANGLP
jgi:hypothetical protein